MMATIPGPIRLSVVIAASSSPSLLKLCLQSLERQQGDGSAIEIIVASNFDGGAQTLIDEEFQNVRGVFLPASTTVPELRTKGILHANGEIVALIEDNCIVDENWCHEIIQAHELPHSIIGGTVENGCEQRPVDWAVYFYEYGKYMLPISPSVTDSLAGNNVSYKMALLEKYSDHIRNGVFEAFFHQTLQGEGYQLYLHPKATVYHTKQYDPKEVRKSCYYHGRFFAGRRTVCAPIAQRMKFLFGSVLLPLLLPFRIVRRVYQKNRCVRELWSSFSYLIVFMSIWGFGEFSGYLWGEGESSKQWK